MRPALSWSDARLGWRFSRAVLDHAPEADDLRAQIVAGWGRRAITTLALGIASARVYPTVKVAMGHGRACVRVRIAGVDARPPHASLATAA